MSRAAADSVRVLVADDEESMRYFVAKALRRRGYETEAVADGIEAIRAFERHPAAVAVLDLKMPGADGLQVLEELRKRDPEVIVILMSAYATVASAVQAMRNGAYDYVTKPFEADELLLLIDRALQHRATVRENRDLRGLIDRGAGYAGLVGQSPAMKRVYDGIDRLRESDATVLITGESGTGKELVARAIHIGSARKDAPFVAISCAALTDNLVDSELFGHVPGAFTGAEKHKEGLVGRAHHGTLFLDEVAEASLHAQTKFERFLQEREFLPVGGTDPKRVDVRVIAATNRDIEQRVEAGLVRRELYFRLNVVPIHLPPLRERREDIPILANHFLGRLTERAGATPSFDLEAAVVLANHDWPGNVRQLQNVVERVVALSGGREAITVEDLPDDVRASTSSVSAERPIGPMSYEQAMTSAERAYLRDLLRRTTGNVSEAARAAGLSRGHLHRKVTQLGIDPDEFRA